MRGFTRSDLVALLAVAGIAVIAVGAIGIRRIRSETAKQKDGAHLRGLGQALVTWRQSNNDEYPVPSRIDRSNATVSVEGTAKNATPNMYSILVFNGTIGAELLVSVVETNPHVRVCSDYEFDKPKTAVDPTKACWDPKLSAALDGSSVGNISYAHLEFSDGRLPRWQNTFNSSEIILSNRGPEITSATPNPDSSVTPALANPASNTLRFYGRGRSWSGWAAFNDNHVEFRNDFLGNGRTFKPEGIVYTTGSGVQLPDIWCYDELNDPKAANDYIGIFLKAGSKREDWLAAWD